jgi:hypothetical protein
VSRPEVASDAENSFDGLYGREFVRAYEPDGMTPSEFISFGPTQRTLSQFSEAGWKLMESFR